MLNIRFIFTSLALAAATGILFISLSSVSTVESSSGGNQSMQFYMGEEILPDHVAYPVLMVIDRVRLESATPVEQIYLKTSYANQRLKYAEELLDKNDTDLAVTTITKAEKYLLSAGNQAIELEMSQTVTKHIIATLEYHQEKTNALSKEFNGTQKAVIDGLNEQTSVMLTQLSSRL